MTGQLQVTRDSAMGANLVPGGATFRTWAPNATGVSVVAGPALAAALADPAWRPAPSDRLVPLGDGSWGGAQPSLADGAPYLFFIEGVGSTGWKRDPFARELGLDPAFPDCTCLVRAADTYPWHDEGWRTPRYPDLVIYQLHIGTWWAQDGSGADARTAQGGRFLDAVEKLGHLRALGVTAVQLLPVQEFESSFSMGYNGVDYFSPEGRYQVPPSGLAERMPGINAMLAGFGKPPLTEAQLAPGVNQLRCLVDLCHLHGIAVILDLVYNHAGGGFDDRSLWFYDRQANGDLNHSLYFTDQGWAGGEIFAYWNDWVSQFLIDNARHFLTEYRIDGIRYDEVRVIEDNGGRAFCQHLTETVRATNPSCIQIAEYWNPDRPSAVHAPPTGLGFDAELGDGLRDALRDLLSQAARGEAAPLSLAAVAGALVPADGFDAGWRLVQCLENQDLTYLGHSGAGRVPALADAADPRSWYGRSRSRVASALLLTAPGIPALFMGQEFMEERLWCDTPSAGGLITWPDGGDASRTDFLRFMTDLVRLRFAEPALRADGVRVSRAEDYDRVLVLHRWVPGQGGDVIVVASLDEQPKHGYAIGLPYAGSWRELFNSDVYEGFPNSSPVGNGGWVQAAGPALDGFAASASVTIPANGVVVLGRPGGT